MSRVAQYGLSGILLMLALASYLSWLAERDQKAFQFYQEQKHQEICSILPRPHPDYVND